MNRTRTKVVSVSSSLIMLGLLLGSSSAFASTTPAAKRTATSGTLTVAVAAGFSGNEAFIGPRILNGVEVAVHQINAAGGLLGKKLRIVTTDTANDPVDAVPAVSQVIATQHPFAMIGPASVTIMAVVRQINQDKLVDVTLGGTTELDHMRYPYIFRTSPSDSQLGVAMAYYGIKKGYKRAALVFDSSSSAQTLTAPVAATLKKHGVKVVINESIVSDQSSYRSEIERLILSKPSVIYMQVDPQTASTFFSELQQLGGGNIPVIGSDVTAAASFAKAMTYPYAERVLTSVQGSTIGGPAANLYTRFYTRYFHGQQPLTLSNNAYDAMNIIAMAVLKAKSASPSKYVKDMVSVANGPGTSVYDFAQGAKLIKEGKAVNYQGASGPENFNRYHNVTGAFEAVKWVNAKGGPRLAPLAQITPMQLLGY